MDKKPHPFTASAYINAVKHRIEHGHPTGSRPGWPSVDKLFMVYPGQLTILTGWPGHGKSEWLDALLINLLGQGWRHVIYSPENTPVSDHVAKMVEKILCKPIDKGPTPQMTADEATEAIKEHLEEYVIWFDTMADQEQESWALQDILDGADAAIRQKRGTGSWGADSRIALVIDPWNEIEHYRRRELSETEYISETLMHLRKWARSRSAHVFLVAHPQKLRRDDTGKLPIPRPDSISGSQHWWNKADNCITVWRDTENIGPNVTKIYIQKVRFKYVGKIGEAVLHYDYITGRYNEPLTMIHGNGAPTW